MSALPDTDAILVARSAAGDRAAFATIVARYQRLVCSVAYAASGRFHQSEDLAQETFLIAWRQLATLQDPDSLRAWLCGIARNLARNVRRAAGNDALIDGDDVADAAAHLASGDVAPGDAAIRAEEQAILWRAIGRMPALYREPLVLFYREHQSVERVAQSLGLEEATVRQRLARGRRLLQDEVLAFVEGALERSNPGAAFTLAVVAAIPVSAPTVAAGAAIGATQAAAHSTAAAKSGALLAMLASIAGPVISLVSGFFAIRASLDTTRTATERRETVRAIRRIVAVSLVFTAAIVGLIASGDYWTRHPLALTAVGAAIPIAFAAWFARVVATGITAQRRLRATERARIAGDHGDAATVFAGGLSEYRSRASFLGLPLVHTRFGVPAIDAPPVRAWFAVGDRAIGGLFALGGIVIAPVSVGSVAVGALSVGTVAIGVVPMAAVALGAYALGTASFGWFAIGALSIGWHGAVGGLAIARDVAGGGYAIAAHANDAIAQQVLPTLLPPWLFLSMLATLAVLAIVPTAWYASRVRRLHPSR